MATGIPKKNTGLRKNSDRGAEAVVLHYAGKTPREEVIASKGTRLELVASPKEFKGEGRLFYGENLGVMRSLLEDNGVRGKVTLVYIDPPYATQGAFHSRNLNHAYEDTLVGSEFIEWLRQRLIVLYELLSENGSLYLHLDDNMVFQMKLVLDEIFGPQSFRNCIVRKKCNPKNYTSRQYGNVSDYVLFYTKSDNYVWNRPVEEWTPERAKEYQYIEPETGRRFMKVPIHAPGVRNGETGQMWRGMMPPPGKHWQYTPSKLDEFDAKGEIFWSANGNPRRKVYLDEHKGVGVQDIWLEYRDAHNQNVCITGYPTEKNPALLERIINASSNPGDLVLDAFGGSGTTAAVAGQLGRRWALIDNSHEAISTILRRFDDGLSKMGDFVGNRSQKKSSNLEQSLMPFERELNVSQRIVSDYQFIASEECYENAKQVYELRRQRLKVDDPRCGC